MNDTEYLARVEGAFDAATEIDRLLRLDGHKCEMVASLKPWMSEGRDWWLGQLTEPIAGWPAETHCLHIQTPLKSVVLGVKSADATLLAVLCQVIHDGPINPEWLDRMERNARRCAELAKMPPEEDRPA